MLDLSSRTSLAGIQAHIQHVSSAVCQDAMNSMVALGHQAEAERKFCELLKSIFSCCPPVASSSSTPDPSVMQMLQQQLYYAKQVLDEVVSEVQALGCEGGAPRPVICQTSHSACI